MNIIFHDSLAGYATLPRKTSRSYRFLEALDGFEEFEDDEIYERLGDLSDAFESFERHKDYSWHSDEELEEHQIQTEWLKNKSDEWLQAFYAFLSDGTDDFRFISFIKLADKSFNFSDESLYFPEQGLSIDAELFFVDSNTYSSGSNQKQQEKALEFLQSEGVQSVDESTHIEFLFNSYQFTSKKQHLVDINRLVEFYMANKKDAISLMRDEGYGFIYSESHIEYCFELDGEDAYDSDPLANPSEVFIDSPYEPTGLNFIYSQFKSYFMISKIYKKLDNWTAFIELLKYLGAKTEFEIEWTSINYNVNKNILLQARGQRFTNTGIHQDWKIDGLDRFLEIEDNRHEISKVLWNFLSSTDSKHFTAVYRLNSAYKAVYADSQLTHTLKNVPWIPDKNGIFYKPEEISKEMLHPDFDYEKSSGWLERLGFGVAVAEKLQEDEAKKQVLIDTGLDPEIAALLSVESPEMVKGFLEEFKAKKLGQSLKKSQGSGKTQKVAPFDGPGSAVNDPNELEKKIGQDIEKTPPGNTPKNKTRSVSTKDPKNTAEIRSFLYGQYNGHCQICGDTFMQKKDRNFFELYSLNRSKKGDRLKSDINRAGNSLSLCPKHHTILKLGIQKFTFLDKIPSSELTQDLVKSLFEVRGYATNEEDEFYNAPEGSGFYLEDALMLPIEIFGEGYFIKFSEEHMIHLIQVFNKR